MSSASTAAAATAVTAAAGVTAAAVSPGGKCFVPYFSINPLYKLITITTNPNVLITRPDMGAATHIHDLTHKLSFIPQGHLYGRSHEIGTRVEMAITACNLPI